MSRQAVRRDGTCFHEADPGLALPRRALAEGVGTSLLVFTVVASALTRSGTVAPVARALSVGPALTGLILVFGQVSGGHFNPLITLAQWLGGQRSPACLAGYIAAQLAGAVLGARLAAWTFGAGETSQAAMAKLPAVAIAELFATTGLMLVVLAAPRMRPAGIGPLAVGGWVGMTIAGLAAAPAANPAITFALFVTPLAPTPGAAVTHGAAQIAGLAAAMLTAALTAAPATQRPGQSGPHMEQRR